MNARAMRPGLRLVTRPAAVEASLWRRWRIERQRACRPQLFDHYLGFAKRVARGEAGRRPAYGLDRGDLEQLAFQALLEAIDRYDPLRGAPFEAYARPRIRGAISDGLSQSSEAASQYSYRRRVEGERLRSLTTGLSETDPIAALAELASGLALGLVVEDAARLLEEQPSEEPNAYESMAWRELQRDMLDAVAALPETQRIILQQHYINGVDFARLAELLQLSRGRVSQLHRTALLAVRARLRYKD
jgi:RNA polymerase sigma factor for flagellar operon FliA